MTDYMRGDAQDVDVGVRGFASLNNAQTTQIIEPDFTLTPGRIDPERDVVIGPGDVSYNAAKGGYDVTGTQISLESARTVRYRPGGLSFAGAAVVIPEPPTDGRFEVGLGNVPFEDYQNNGVFGQSDAEILLRLRPGGEWAYVIRRDGVETVIPRSKDATYWDGTPADGRSWDPSLSSRSGEEITDQNGNVSGKFWGFDAVNGDGPDQDNSNRSGLSLDDYPLMVIPKLVGTWYGKGPYYLGFEVTGSGGYQRHYPAVAFQAKGQSISTRASLPLTIRYDDEGAGNSYDFEVYGRQGSGGGEVADQPGTPFEFQPDVSLPAGTTPSDGSLIIAFRRAPESSVATDVNFRSSIFGLLRLTLATPNRAVIFTSLDPDFGTQTPAWRTPDSVQNQPDTAIQVADQDGTGADLTADPTGGVIQEAAMVDGGSKENAEALDPVNQATPRTKPVGIFAFATDSAVQGSADLLATFEEQPT